MKLSEMTTESLANWAHVQPDDKILPLVLEAAKSSVLSDTGLSEAAADKHEDLTIAALILAADMIYNRSVHIDSGNVNKVYENIVNLHSHNLLPGIPKVEE